MVGRRFLNPLFYKDPLYCLPSFFKSCLPPPPFPSPPTSTFTILCVVLFLWLNGWSRHIWCIILPNNLEFNYNIILLVPEGSCCVFYATRRQVYWGLKHCASQIYLLIRCKFFLWSTNKTDRNGPKNPPPFFMGKSWPPPPPFFCKYFEN